MHKQNWRLLQEHSGQLIFTTRHMTCALAEMEYCQPCTYLGGSTGLRVTLVSRCALLGVVCSSRLAGLVTDCCCGHGSTSSTLGLCIDHLAVVPARWGARGLLLTALRVSLVDAGWLDLAGCCCRCLGGCVSAGDCVADVLGLNCLGLLCV